MGCSAGEAAAAAVVEEMDGGEADWANQRGWAEDEDEEATASGILVLLFLLLLLLLLAEALLLLSLLLLLLRFASLRRASMDDEVDILRRDSIPRHLL